MRILLSDSILIMSFLFMAVSDSKGIVDKTAARNFADSLIVSLQELFEAFEILAILY